MTEQNQNNSSNLLRQLLPLLLTILVVYSFIIIRHARHDNHNLTSFACIGEWYAAPELMEGDVVTIENSPGYDGEFFMFAAHDPFILKTAKDHMDAPAYRYQRIMYPWLAALFSMGNIRLIPLMMILVNIGMVLIGSFFIARMLIENKLSPWYGLIYAFLNGIILCVLRDLSGPVAAGFMAGAIYYYLSHKYIRASLLLACSILSKEIGLILLFCWAIDMLLIKKQWKNTIVMGLSAVPFALWQSYIWIILHELPTGGHSRVFGMPLIPVVKYIRSIFQGDMPVNEVIYGLLFVSMMLLTVFIAGKELYRSRDSITIPFFVFSILPIFMTGYIWQEPWSYARVMIPMYIFLIYSFANTPDKLHKIALAGQAATAVIAIWWVGIF